MASLLSTSPENMDKAALFIRSGGLVAFPTETVYGLGANALNEKAVLSIFAAKGRPLTDPLIVHITSADDALRLLSLPPSERLVFWQLANQFWPGPLTIVAQASEIIPPQITANTGFVGVRFPSHPIAQDLIRLSGCPIAAPSANRFGHVSPTLADHVVSDLGASGHEILVIDGGSESCGVGIESTVMRMESQLVEDSQSRSAAPQRKLVMTVLRRGAVTPEMITDCLASQDTGFDSFEVRVAEHKQKSEAVAQMSPGQLLTHYAPDVPAFILRKETDSGPEVPPPLATPLSKCVVIDFGGENASLKDKVLAYRDLSESSDCSQAAKTLFSALRWAEMVQNAATVLLPDLKSIGARMPAEKAGLAAAVFDRVFRAASGRAVTLAEQ